MYWRLFWVLWVCCLGLVLTLFWKSLFCDVVLGDTGFVCDFRSTYGGYDVRVLFMVLLGWGCFVYLEWCLLVFCVCSGFRFVFVSLVCVLGEFVVGLCFCCFMCRVWRCGSGFLSCVWVMSFRDMI